MGFLDALNVDFINVMICTLTSIVFTFWFIPRIIVVSFKKKLFDYSDGRKIHTGVVPRLGGVAFVPSILIAINFAIGLTSLVIPNHSTSLHVQTTQLAFGLCSLTALYFGGIMDDLVGLRYRVKFLIQIICALLLVSSGIWINNFHGLLFINTVPAWFGMPFSLLLIVFIINAINLIDGIDGLASGLSIVATFFFGVLYCYEGSWDIALLSFAVLGTLIPFFYYNVFGGIKGRRKIFMGDAGSQCIGLLLSALAIRLSVVVPNEQCQIDGIIIVSFSMLIVPMFDVIRVMLHRLRRNKNMFLPDNSHIHHKLLMLGMTHKMAMATILFVAMLFVMLNLILLNRININLILLLDIAIWTIFNIALTKMINKGKSKNDRF